MNLGAGSLRHESHFAKQLCYLPSPFLCFLIIRNWERGGSEEENWSTPSWVVTHEASAPQWWALSLFFFLLEPEYRNTGLCICFMPKWEHISSYLMDTYSGTHFRTNILSQRVKENIADRLGSQDRTDWKPSHKLQDLFKNRFGLQSQTGLEALDVPTILPGVEYWGASTPTNSLDFKSSRPQKSHSEAEGPLPRTVQHKIKHYHCSFAKSGKCSFLAVQINDWGHNNAQIKLLLSECIFGQGDN